MSCCQDGSLVEQMEYGVRHFCIRLDTDRKGNIVCCHGISKGKTLSEALKGVREFMETHPSEVLLLDIREYYDQKLFGPVVLRYSADPEKVDAVLKQTIEPEKYAYTDFNELKEKFAYYDYEPFKDIDDTLADLRNTEQKFLFP